MTVRRAVRSALVACTQRVVGLLIGLGASYALVHLAGLDAWLDLHTADPAVAAHPAPAQQEAARLIGTHRCWTGAAPADMRGKIPGHAVVTRSGAAHPVYGGGGVVSAALEHVFGHQHPQLRVHAFCR